jgi:hypothetical protein
MCTIITGSKPSEQTIVNDQRRKDMMGTIPDDGGDQAIRYSQK